MKEVYNKIKRIFDIWKRKYKSNSIISISFKGIRLEDKIIVIYGESGGLYDSHCEDCTAVFLDSIEFDYEILELESDDDILKYISKNIERENIKNKINKCEKNIDVEYDKIKKYRAEIRELKKDSYIEEHIKWKKRYIGYSERDIKHYEDKIKEYEELLK